MIHQALKTAISSLIPNVTVFSQNKTDFLERVIASELYLKKTLKIDWSHYNTPIKIVPSGHAINKIAELINRPLNETNLHVYVFLVFKCSTVVIKTDILSLLKNYNSVHDHMTNILVWNPTEGYVLESEWPNELIVGLVDKSIDPIPDFAPEKNSDAYKFMLNKGAFHEFIKSFGLELLGDDEANTILAKFQTMLPFTRWGCINWHEIESKIFIGKNKKDILPTLQRLLSGPFDTKMYCEQRLLEAPLMRFNLTQELAEHWSIWGRGYGTFLFNMEAGYVIEADPQDNITVGLIPSKEN